MGLLVPPVTPPKGDAQAALKTAVTSSIQRCYAMMLRAYTDNMGQVWENDNGLSPQDAFDAFGTDAADLVRLATILVSTINAATPDTLPTPDPTVLTVNSDGTVSVKKVVSSS